MKKPVMFHGERVHWSRGIFQLFKDMNGKDHSFVGIKHLYFGDVVVMENNQLKIRPETIKAPWEPTEKERLEYETQKVIVTDYRSKKKKWRDMKKPDPQLLRAVDAFRPFYLHLSNYDRNRLIEWFENQCSKKKKRA